jgi:hypothetical protein
MLRSQDKTNLDHRVVKIENIDKFLSKLSKKPKAKWTVNDYKKYRKETSRRHDLQRKMDTKRVFGSYSRLRRISYLSNTAPDSRELRELREEYRSERISNIYVIGEANQKGNRFFDFGELDRGILIYKPNKATKIEIELNTNPGLREKLSLISKLAQSCEIAITVEFCEDWTSLSYDEHAYAAYRMDMRERDRRIKTETEGLLVGTAEYKSQVKSTSIAFYRDEELKVLCGKSKTRVMAIDSNPNHIGVAVIDNKNSTNDFDVVKCIHYDLSYYNKLSEKKLPGATDRKKHALSLVIKDIFKEAKYLNVGVVTLEDLNFDHKKVNDNSREFNRLSRNGWNREQIDWLVTKRAASAGMLIRKVNAAYSSFIGNILHNYSDACNAAIELARRGSLAYVKGHSVYPIVDVNTVALAKSKLRANNPKLRDVELGLIESAMDKLVGWEPLHGFLVTSSGFRYRAPNVFDVGRVSNGHSTGLYELPDRCATLNNQNMIKYIF